MLYMGALTTPMATFQEIFKWAFVPIEPIKLALPVSEIIGGTPQNWAVPGYSHAPFSEFLQNISWAFVRMDPVNVLAKFEVRSFTRSYIGGTPKIGQSLDIAHAPFSPKLLMGFCSDGPCECSGQI